MNIGVQNIRFFKAEAVIIIMENARTRDYVHQLSEHIIKNLDKGYTADALKFSLMSQGYSRITVENAIEIANKKIAEKIPPINEKPEISYKIIPEPEKKGFWETVKGWFR